MTTLQASTSAIWHAGEKRLQQAVGVSERMDDVGQRVIRRFMPEQHRAFFAKMPFMIVGSVDDHDDAWASVLVGEPGFVTSPSPTRLVLQATRDPGDPAVSGLAAGRPIGMLGIELDTRRRNRVNGHVVDATAGRIVFDVEQSFGNCPQYIQLRDYGLVRDPAVPFTAPVEESAMLDAGARATITQADTFFVASYADRDDGRQVDVSHRGGKPGFVRIADDGTLTIPDFAGNLFFSTLGNMLLNGKAGLVFVDFASGDVLQLSGDAEVVLDSPEIAAFQGAERLWTFRARRVVRRRGALAIRWTFAKDGWSPNVLMTGDWDETAKRLEAIALGTRWRPYTVTRIVDESASIRSFHLMPDDGAGLLPHEPGQHLPIQVTPAGSDTPLLRTYTLSSTSSDGEYRISVKRDGRVSTHLHDAIHVGDVIHARAPAGAFTLDLRGKRPVVMLAGGVGITPMLAMLRAILYEGLRTRGIRPTVLFQAAHTLTDLAFTRELDGIVDAARGAIRVIRVLGDATGARERIDYDVKGRIDMAMLTRFLPFDDYDFYLCGPAAFTQSLYDGLRGRNIADDRIHAEAFGPSSLRRSTPSPSTATPLEPAATEPVPVVFTTSLKEARWTPESGSLLELAESRGLSPPFSCRAGTCGSCRTPLLGGKVTYRSEPTAPHAENEVLICCAVPAAQDATSAGVQLAL